MKFEELTFARDAMGEHTQVMFPNGRGASIIRGPHTYGGSAGKYELAVLTAEGALDYTTPITDDVLGWLDEEEVEKTLQQIADLPAAGSEPAKAVEEAGEPVPEYTPEARAAFFAEIQAITGLSEKDILSLRKPAKDPGLEID